MVAADRPAPPSDSVGRFLRHIHTERRTAGPSSVYASHEVTKREVDRARRFLGVSDRQLIRMVNNPVESNGRIWFAPGTKRRPGGEYMLRILHLVMLKAEGRLDVRGGYVLDLDKRGRWPLNARPLMDKEGKPVEREGLQVIQRSYWETEWVRTR